MHGEDSHAAACRHVRVHFDGAGTHLHPTRASVHALYFPQRSQDGAMMGLYLSSLRPSPALVLWQSHHDLPVHLHASAFLNQIKRLQKKLCYFFIALALA